MTISAKLVDVGGLAFAVSEETDTIDVNGFSDTINIEGAAKTAKFSDTSVMKANVGLRLGITQLRIDTGTQILPFTRPRTIIFQDGDTLNGANAIDGDLNTSANAIFADISPFVWMVVDFGSIATIGIFAKIDSGGNANDTTLEISQDNVIWVVVSTSVLGGLQTHDGGIQTYRYARIVGQSGLTIGASDIFEIYESDGVGDVTVNIRSSTTQDGINGIILETFVISPESSLLFDNELLLTGTGEFLTMEITSFAGDPMDVSLSLITSIREE